MQRQHFHTLDGMRGIAAFSVVLFHLGLWTFNPWFFSHGYLAVDFFFCLSGFVVAFVFTDRFSMGMSFTDFVLQRLIRLYPIIFLGMILGFLFFAAFSVVAANQQYGVTDVVTAFLLNITLIPFVGFRSPIDVGIYPLNSVFWSILFEILINLAWALLLRRVPAWVCFLGSVILSLVFFPLLPSLDVGGFWNQALWGLLRVSVGFSAGLWVHELYKKGVEFPKINAGWLLIALLILLAMPQVGGVWFDLACVIVFFPLITLAGISAVSGASVAKLMDFSGKISYPLYGVHRPISLAIVSVALKVHLAGAPIVALAAFAFGATIVAATFAERWFERPAREILGKLDKSRRDKLIARRQVA